MPDCPFPPLNLTTSTLDNGTEVALDWDCDKDEENDKNMTRGTICRLPCPEGTDTNGSMTGITLDVICKPETWFHNNNPGLQGVIIDTEVREQKIKEFIDLCDNGPTGIIHI